MHRNHLNSSNVVSAGYDDATSTLEIEFKNGGVYQYFGVPSAIYEDFKHANSHGGFFREQIRGVFRYARV